MKKFSLGKTSHLTCEEEEKMKRNSPRENDGVYGDGDDAERPFPLASYVETVHGDLFPRPLLGDPLVVVVEVRKEKLTIRKVEQEEEEGASSEEEILKTRGLWPRQTQKGRFERRLLL